MPWSKGCCGGRKTRSNCRPNLFSSYHSNDDESGENDHGNEFIGSKNGGREVWVGLKWQENGNIWRPKVAATAAFADPIYARPVAVGREITQPRSFSGGAPPWLTRVARGWLESAPTVKTRMA